MTTITNKTLTVATEVQRVIFTQVLLDEIEKGFWKNARPVDHAESWEGVTIVVGSNLGPNGFDVPRKYNFVNPDFFIKAETKLLAAARMVNQHITTKQLKKQLISLNQILDSRLKEIGGAVTKLPRGRKPNPKQIKTTVTGTSTVRKVAANVVDPEKSTETTEA